MNKLYCVNETRKCIIDSLPIHTDSTSSKHNNTNNESSKNSHVYLFNSIESPADLKNRFTYSCYNYNGTVLEEEPTYTESCNIITPYFNSRNVRVNIKYYNNAKEIIKRF